MVKVSVVLPDSIHQELKLASVKKKVSIQRMAQGAIEQMVTLDGGDAAWAAGKVAVGIPDKKEIRVYQDKVKRILESGNADAVNGCTTCIDAMLAYLDINKGGGILEHAKTSSF